MIKATIVALCFFFALINAQNNYACGGRLCLASKASCLPSASQNGVTLYCPKGQYCLYSSDSTSATCTTSVPIGGLCNFTQGNGDAVCAGDFSYCDSGSGGSQTCKNGVNNVQSGGACGSNRFCGNNLYCKFSADFTSATCQPLIAKDGSCDNTAIFGCQQTQQCSLGKCINYYSVAKDGACQSTDDCQAGLFCNGKCTSPVNGNGAYCDTTTPCPSGVVCNCPSNTGNYGVSNQTCQTPTTSTSSQIGTFNAMFNCMQGAGCTYQTAFGGNGVYCNNCKSQICQAIRATTKQSGLDNFCGYPDTTGTLQTYYCNSAATAVASFAAIAVAVFALIM